MVGVKRAALARPIARMMTVAVLLAMVAGCGGANGPERAEVFGRVTFNGEPVPIGQIQYMPDSDKGTNGPQVTLVIRDGYYDSDGKGPVFGHQIVKVSGYTGKPIEFVPEGERLFPVHTEQVEITDESHEVNYDFPISGPSVSK